MLTPAPAVGEGHDPPGSMQKQFASNFGEFEPNSLRIRPNSFANSVPAAGRVMTLPYSSENGTIKIGIAVKSYPYFALMVGIQRQQLFHNLVQKGQVFPVNAADGIKP